MNYEELVKALRSASTVSTAWEKLMRDASAAIEELEATIELMKLNMPDFFQDANKVTLPKMEVRDGQK